MNRLILSVCMTAALGVSIDAQAGGIPGVQDQIDALQSRITALESMLAGVARDGDTLVFEGMNLQITNGMGESDGVLDGQYLTNDWAVNGLGNLIIGYDEPGLLDAEKTGSHNLVVGVASTYTSYGSIVSGVFTGVTAPFGMAIGGFGNSAESPYAVAVGGHSNHALATVSTVVGGLDNYASGMFATVSGGSGNEASGEESTVSGGNQRNATGERDWVAGSLFEDD